MNITITGPSDLIRLKVATSAHTYQAVQLNTILKKIKFSLPTVRALYLIGALYYDQYDVSMELLSPKLQIAILNIRAKTLNLYLSKKLEALSVTCGCLYFLGPGSATKLIIHVSGVVVSEKEKSLS